MKRRAAWHELPGNYTAQVDLQPRRGQPRRWILLGPKPAAGERKPRPLMAAGSLDADGVPVLDYGVASPDTLRALTAAARTSRGQ